MHFVYIIHSPLLDRYYIGESVDADQRVREHNEHTYPEASTRVARDWSLMCTMACADRAHARRLEAWIKSQKSRSVIRRLISEPPYREYQIERFGPTS
jgi:putative endonuclease